MMRDFFVSVFKGFVHFEFYFILSISIIENDSIFWIIWIFRLV